MMLTVLVYASDRCGNNIKPASSRKVFWRFRKVLKAKKFLDVVQHRLDTYSGSRIHRHSRGVLLTFDYICYLFWTTWYSVFEPLGLCRQNVVVRPFSNLFIESYYYDPFIS